MTERPQCDRDLDATGRKQMGGGISVMLVVEDGPEELTAIDSATV